MNEREGAATAAPDPTGVDADLATLRWVTNAMADEWPRRFPQSGETKRRVQEAPEALARVEAELSRLREALDNGDRLLSQAGRSLEAAEERVAYLTDACIREADKVLAAEAELSRLREQRDELRAALGVNERLASSVLSDALDEAEKNYTAPVGETRRMLAARREALTRALAAEARCADLQQDRDEWKASADSMSQDLRTARDSRARLQQALLGTRERTAPDGQPCWCPDWKVDDWRGYSTDDWRDPELQAALHHECCIAAREALAGPDTPADSPPPRSLDAAERYIERGGVPEHDALAAALRAVREGK